MSALIRIILISPVGLITFLIITLSICEKTSVGNVLYYTRQQAIYKYNDLTDVQTHDYMNK